MFYAGRLHTGTRDQSSRAQVVALEEGRWSSTVNQNLGTATCSKHRLGSATAHGLASWGGLVRLLAALRTPEVRLSRSGTSGSAWRSRQPVPRAPMSLPLAVQALTDSRGLKLSAAHAVFTACCCAFASLVAQKPRFAYAAAGVGCGLMILGRCVPHPNPYPDPDPNPNPNPNPSPNRSG